MSLVSNIVPSIIQTFSLIIFGFFCGLIKLVDARQASGIGLYVAKFALPCLLFNAMFHINVEDVNWSLIASIAVAKLILYFSVFIFCAIIVRPRNLGTASIIGLFCTQTNDFSIFLPVLKSMFPNLEIYVYLLSPVQMIIPCTFSYFFLEWEFSKTSHNSQEFQNSTTTQKFCSVLIRIFSNPLFFMTSLGIIFNILFKSYIPDFMTNILKVVADSFPSTALFFLGFSMIGKMGRLKSSAILSLSCLIIVKFIVSPFIMRQFTNYVLSFCGNSNVVPYLSNFTTFAFLYGTSPTSPAVFLIAYEYGAFSDVISTGVVVCTCLFGPVVIIYATVVMFYDSKHIEKYQTEVRPTMNWVSILSLICLIWTLIKVWKNDKTKYYYVRWALNFMCIFTITMCFGNFLSQISLTKETNGYIQTVAFFFIFVGMLGTRLWSVFLVILKYLQLQQQITRNMKIPISSINLILIITGVGSPILAAILAFAMKSNEASDITNPFYSYGLHQEIIVIVWLFVCLFGSLIFLLKMINLRLKESYLAHLHNESNYANSTKLTKPLIENENEQNIAAINRYLCFFIYTIISLFLCCSLTSWRLINDVRLGVYVILEFLDSILIYGQGIFVFIIFGPQIGVFVIPIKERIASIYRSFKAKYLPKRRKFKEDQESGSCETDLDLSRIHNEMSAVEFFNTFHRKHAVRNLSHDWTFRSNDDINLQGFTEANFIEWFILFMSVQDKIPKSYLNFCEKNTHTDSHECLRVIGSNLFLKLLEEDQLNRNNNFSEKIEIFTFKEAENEPE